MSKHNYFNASVVILLTAFPALGADYSSEPQLTSSEAIFEFYGSVGILALEGREHVFSSAGSSDHTSLLIWQSLAPILSSGFKVNFPDNWTLNGTVQVAMLGDSYMEDYDWLAPFAPSFDFEDWSHRSQHGNTNLDWYFRGSLALGYDFIMDESTTVNLNAGVKYIDVQWAAVGGTYTYSTGGFRDNSGTFADVPGITYRQQLPSVFVGVDTETVRDDWTFDFGVQAGLTVMGKATDWHWLRVPPLRFVDTFMPAPTIAISAGASYDLGDNLNVFVSGNLEKIFLARGDTQIYNNDTNALLSTFLDQAGAELASASITAGLKGTF